MRRFGFNTVNRKEPFDWEQDVHFAGTYGGLTPMVLSHSGADDGYGHVQRYVPIWRYAPPVVADRAPPRERGRIRDLF
jgi:hypothetical protein